MVSISIIIPVYNVGQYIEACLKSIMAQTYTGSMECLIVDDCAQDNSIEIAQNVIANYQGPISFRVLHHNRNRGLSAARNTGMNEAVGDYFFFADSDDELPADSIERLVTALGNEHFDLVVGGIKTIGDDGLHEYLRMRLADGTVLRGIDIISHYKSHWNMMAQAKLYNATFLRNQQITFKEGIIHEDELWSFEIACTAKTFKAVQQPTYLYYVREGSICVESNKDKREKTKILIEIIAEMTVFLRTRKIISLPAYNIIQKMTEDILHFEKTDRQHFRQTYLDLREKNRLTWLYRIRVKGMNIRAQIQELHYLLPPSLGERYKYWRITK